MLPTSIRDNMQDLEKYIIYRNLAQPTYNGRSIQSVSAKK